METEFLLGWTKKYEIGFQSTHPSLIREMNLVPFSRQQMLQIAVIASLPGLPLIFLVMPVGELLKLLAGALL